MPNSAFFNRFHKQKKFSETVFIKLSANPLLAYITGDFTNYFSVLCQKRLFLKSFDRATALSFS